MKFELTAYKRSLQGSGASRRLRRAHKVPAIVYGGAKAPAMIELDHNELLLALRKEAFHSSVLSLKVDGVAESVLLRDSQMHPYKALVQHVDFLRIDAEHEINQKVPLHFINGDVAPGVKLADGIVSPAINDLDISCLPKDLPAFIEVDLKNLDIGDTVHVSEILLPAGVKTIGHGTDDPVVVSITAKKTAPVEGEEGEEGEVGEEGGAEPAA